MAATAPDVMFSLKAGQRGTNAPLMALSFHQKEKFFPEHPHSTPAATNFSYISLDHMTRGWASAVGGKRVRGGENGLWVS